MNIGLSLSQEQKQKISATQIQSLKLLAMDNFELRQMMESEYLENPLLEYERRTCAAPIQNGYVSQEQWRQEIPTQEQTLEQFILNQLNMHKYSRKEWSVVKFLVGNLDGNGFLTAEASDMAKLTGMSEEQIHRLLVDLKKLEPCGIFARDLRECLLLQLYAQGIPDPLVKVLVSDHLEALGRGDIRGVAKALALPPAQIRKALSQISQLNPRPLNGLDTTRTDYVIPDILLHWDPESQTFQASLNDDWFADYSISDYYLQMVQKTEDPQLREYFEKKYFRAKMLIEGIEQRRATLLALGNYIGDKQAGFLLGRETRAGITMTEAAAALDMAISTVSRAVKGKYVQYPKGCVPFKSLFETPVMLQQELPARGREEIKEILKDIIENEDKSDPLSDSDLVERLEEMGIPISRRTVAKYRDALGIKGRFDRRLV